MPSDITKSWESVIKYHSKKVLAPMVDQSELAWRILSRRHGAQLCYTPMLHASIFVRDPRYRKENLVTCAEDRPLIVQFCANEPDTLLEAVRLVVGHCDAVDLNLGCPQAIAKRGHYGAYLQDEWELVQKMIESVHSQVDVPICCKIRIFDDVDKTVAYAKMLESAGCQMLAVHGRTREQKGRFTGIASWKHIKAIKDNVKIPVLANGNIQYGEDFEKCINETGADGVMIAEGSLYNPTLFENRHLPVWEVALEYLDLVLQYPCPMSYIRGHLFKLFHHCLLLPENRDLQEELAKATNMDGFRQVTLKLKSRFQCCEPETKKNSLPQQLPLPVYICQPYIRPNDDSACNSTQISEKGKSAQKRACGTQIDTSLSKRKQKKLLKNPKKKFERKNKEEYEMCKQCCNPKGSKCASNLCRACCRTFSYMQLQDCPGHRFLFKTKKPLRRNSHQWHEGLDCSNSELGVNCATSLA